VLQAVNNFLQESLKAPFYHPRMMNCKNPNLMTETGANHLQTSQSQKMSTRKNLEF